MLRVSTALAFSASSCLGSGGGDAAKTVTFTKDVATIFNKMRIVPSPNNMVPMSLLTYEEARPWAKSIASRRRAADAAVAHRQDDRHPEVQERPSRTTIRSRPSSRGSCRGAKGDPKDMPAPKVWKDESGWNMANSGGPDLVVKSPDTMPPVAQDAGGADQPDQHHRTAVCAIEIRPVGKNARKITHHAPPSAAGSMDPALFTNDERLGDGLFKEWAVGVERRRCPTGPPDAAQLEDRERCTITRSARRSRRTPNWRWFYPKGRTEAPRSARALQHVLGAPRRPLARHPAELGDDRGCTLKQNARSELPGACTCAARASMEAIFPDGCADVEPVTDFNSTGTTCHLRRRCGALP
jgi:hypothetical protein